MNLTNGQLFNLLILKVSMQKSWPEAQIMTF